MTDSLMEIDSLMVKVKDSLMDSRLEKPRGLHLDLLKRMDLMKDLPKDLHLVKYWVIYLVKRWEIVKD